MRRLFGSEINEEKGGTYRKDVGIGRFDFFYFFPVVPVPKAPSRRFGRMT